MSLWNTVAYRFEVNIYDVWIWTEFSVLIDLWKGFISFLVGRDIVLCGNLLDNTLQRNFDYHHPSPVGTHYRLGRDSFTEQSIMTFFYYKPKTMSRIQLLNWLYSQKNKPNHENNCKPKKQSQVNSQRVK